MLARGHRLAVGGVGIVGYVSEHREPRISLDVGDDAVYFDNPDLPETRSEMALPLIVGDRLLGVLDIQSRQPAAFTQDDVVVLRSLADQVAVAIDNARLITEAQVATAAERRAYGEVSLEAWRQLASTHNLSYVANAQGEIAPSAQPPHPAMLQCRRTGKTVRIDPLTVVVPIKVRGQQVLGVIKFAKPEASGPWTAQQLAMMDTLADRLSQALESARLYEDSQRRAARERLVGDVTARMRQSLNLDMVLRTAAEEMRELLQAPEVTIRLTPPASNAGAPSSENVG